MPPGVEGARYLSTAKTAVGQHAAVLSRKRNTLGDALIDDAVAHLGQAIDVGFPGTEITALDGVVKQAPDAVAVIGVIFGGIDAALGCNTVGPAGAVLDTEGFDVVAQLGQGGRGRAPGQAGSHDDDRIFAFVGRVHQFGFKAVFVPFILERAAWGFSIQLH